MISAGACFCTYANRLRVLARTTPISTARLWIYVAEMPSSVLILSFVQDKDIVVSREQSNDVENRKGMSKQEVLVPSQNLLAHRSPLASYSRADIRDWRRLLKKKKRKGVKGGRGRIIAFRKYGSVRRKRPGPHMYDCGELRGEAGANDGGMLAAHAVWHSPRKSCTCPAGGIRIRLLLLEHHRDSSPPSCISYRVAMAGRIRTPCSRRP